MKRNRKAVISWLVVGLFLAGGATALAQFPDEFTNLQVFPKDVKKQDLVVAMRSFSMALGVRCNHCHATKTTGDSSTIDWVSDDLETKKTARRMMQIVATINTQMLPENKEKSGLRVQCITCHRGLQSPDTLEKVLMKEYSAGGVEAVIASYHNLRGKYYGTGSFNFGPYSLISVAEKLAQRKGDMPGAVSILKLNAEQNPKSADALIVLAQIQAVSGDRPGAILSAENAIKLDPGSEQARQIVDQLKALPKEPETTEE